MQDQNYVSKAYVTLQGLSPKRVSPHSLPLHAAHEGHASEEAKTWPPQTAMFLTTNEPTKRAHDAPSDSSS